MNVMFIRNDNETSPSDNCIIKFSKSDFEKMDEVNIYNTLSHLIAINEDVYEDPNGYETWNIVMEIWENQRRPNVPIQLDYVITLVTYV